MQEGRSHYLWAEPQCSPITQDEQLAQFLSETSDGLSSWVTDITKLTWCHMIDFIYLAVERCSFQHFHSLQSLGPVSTLLCLCFMIQQGPCGIYRPAVRLKISVTGCCPVGLHSYRGVTWASVVTAAVIFTGFPLTVIQDAEQSYRAIHK